MRTTRPPSAALDKLIECPRICRHLVSARVEAIFDNDPNAPPTYVTVWATIHHVTGDGTAWLVIDCLPQGSLQVPRELFYGELPRVNGTSVSALLHQGRYDRIVDESMQVACRALHTEAENERGLVHERMARKLARRAHARETNHP